MKIQCSCKLANNNSNNSNRHPRSSANTDEIRNSSVTVDRDDVVVLLLLIEECHQEQKSSDSPTFNLRHKVVNSYWRGSQRCGLNTIRLELPDDRSPPQTS